MSIVDRERAREVAYRLATSIRDQDVHDAYLVASAYGNGFLVRLRELERFRERLIEALRAQPLEYEGNAEGHVEIMTLARVFQTLNKVPLIEEKEV